jgi:hypothetical protein
VLALVAIDTQPVILSCSSDLACYTSAMLATLELSEQVLSALGTDAANAAGKPGYSPR